MGDNDKARYNLSLLMLFTKFYIIFITPLDTCSDGALVFLSSTAVDFLLLSGSFIVVERVTGVECLLDATWIDGPPTVNKNKN